MIPVTLHNVFSNGERGEAPDTDIEFRFGR